MKMQKRTFRIGELAKHLSLERFVIRFWEKEFALKTHRSHGGQRFYTEDDVRTFSCIKDLLYNRGFTILGAKQQIKSLRQKVAIQKNFIAKKHMPHHKEIEELKKERASLEKRVIILQQQLIKLRELL
ncbi:MAG TPA: MerR family transcriptional regulator [Patescibacteria group bacterium]|jgi:DNA-binding transcriptional MerR regulator|nr:MerR family transcriptional regulator [Patescibacteria group bacterium]